MSTGIADAPEILMKPIEEATKAVSSVNLNTIEKYLDSLRRRDDVLSNLGVVGWEPYERAINVFLLLGGAVLSVGPHGEGKTMLSKRLGTALGVSFAKYDASKSVWEDIMGFPDPARLMDLEKRGNSLGIPRIETPTSIWGKRFILVDEINRATPEMQSKWLEIILERTLMGEPTGTKWIMSCMNPGYAGTNPLDLALVSRYEFFIQAPMGVRGSPDSLMEIMRQENPEEMPAFMTWKNRELVRSIDGMSDIIVQDEYCPITDDQIKSFVLGSNKLKSLLIVAASVFDDVRSRYGKSVDEYVVSVVKTLSTEAKFLTDTRRIRMIKNSILGSIAVEVPVKGTTVSSIQSHVIQDLALQMLYLSFPTVALVDGPSRQQIEASHMKSSDLLEDRSSPVYAITSEADPIKKLELLFQYDEREPILTYKVVKDAVSNDGDFNSYCVAYAMLGAYREGLPLDAQCIGSVMEPINKVLSGNTAGISAMLEAQSDQMAMWDFYSLANSEKFCEAAAFAIAYRMAADEKVQPGNSLSYQSRGSSIGPLAAFAENVKVKYNSVLPTLQNMYSRLEKSIPAASRMPATSSTEEEEQESWESYLSEIE